MDTDVKFGAALFASLTYAENSAIMGETNSLKMIKANNGKRKGVQHVSLDFARPTLTEESLVEPRKSRMSICMYVIV